MKHQEIVIGISLERYENRREQTVASPPKTLKTLKKELKSAYRALKEKPFYHSRFQDVRETEREVLRTIGSYTGEKVILNTRQEVFEKIAWDIIFSYCMGQNMLYVRDVLDEPAKSFRSSSAAIAA